MKKRLIGLLGVAAVVIASVIGSVAAGGAAAASTAGPVRAVAQPFATQAAAAGLTSAQALDLQTQVDQILARDGGTQVAANEIALPHGASVLLALPSHKYARVLPGAVNLGFAPASGRTDTIRATPALTGGSFTASGQTELWIEDTDSVCYYHYLCVWQGQYGAGTQFNVSVCNVDQELPGSGWTTYGSWINNQTEGVRAYFLGKNKNLIYTTPGSGYWESGYNWGPIWYLDACA